MTYSYDRTARVAHSPDHLLDMIVKGVMTERRVTGLITAWEEAKEEEWEEENMDPLPDEFHDHIGGTEAERVYRDAWVKQYKRTDRGYDGNVLELFDYPEKLPQRNVPRKVLEVVGKVMGAHEAVQNARMLEYARRRMGQ